MHTSTHSIDIICESVAGYSWCKRAGGQQVGKCAPCMWGEAILLLRQDSSLFLSCPGGGELREGEGAVGVGINGGWEPEKESASLTERTSERAAGLCDLGQVP